MKAKVKETKIKIKKVGFKNEMDKKNWIELNSYCNTVV